MVTVSLFLLVLGLCPQAKAPEGRDESTFQKLDKEISAVVEKVRPSVVQVKSLGPFREITFSGVVYTRNGHIVTDASGLEQALEIRVTVGDRNFAADRIDADPRTGVAVIKISAEDLTPAILAAESSRPGSMAIVVGNSFGNPGSASLGTVGGLGRSVLVRGRKYENLVQMSLLVHPGDCGGFVADASGRFVGMVHSACAPEPADGPRSGGPEQKVREAPSAVGFATPAAWVKFSADRIIKHGRMVRGWLGLSLLPLADAARSQLRLEAGVGAEVARVERDSPARRTGLEPRDVLVAFEGEPVTDLDALQWKVAQAETARKVKIAFLRNGERREAEIEIEIEPRK